MIGPTDLEVTMALDRGGNGTVYLAIDAFACSYAVKVIVGPEKKALAKREFVFGHNLQHANLGRYLTFTDNTLCPDETGTLILSTCLVLEYIAGRNLLQHVAVHPFCEGVSRFLFS
jgi:hypothetical protein